MIFENENGVEEQLEFKTPDTRGNYHNEIIQNIPREKERVKIGETCYKVVDILHVYNHVNMDLNHITIWLKKD